MSPFHSVLFEALPEETVMERERTGRAGKRGKVKGEEEKRAGEERERNGKSMSLFNSPLLEALPDVTPSFPSLPSQSVEEFPGHLITPQLPGYC